ncbi:MAG: GNAT family N-acetyltransferase [Cyanobacteria bacterium P01_D01_bin.2]
MATEQSRDFSASPWTIRPAHRSDITHLPAIERAAAQRYVPYLPQLGLISDQLKNIVSLGFLHRALQQNHLWVAMAQKTHPPARSAPIGFIVVDRLNHGFFVVELDVLPDYGRQGIGSALVNQVIEAACHQRLKTVTLTTFRHVPWTIPFYRQLGFEIVLPADYTPDIRAIVNHEERHGFSRQVRVVMQCQIPPPSPAPIPFSLS